MTAIDVAGRTSLASRDMAMNRIDSGYLYQLGATLPTLRRLGQGDMAYPSMALSALISARDSAHQLIEFSLFSPGLRASRNNGHTLVQELNALIARIQNQNWPNPEDTFGQFDTFNVSRAYHSFETVMLAELQGLPVFIVPPRGAFDNAYLIEWGETLFPESLIRKVPDTLLDVRQAGKCIAFDLPTAAGFHLHRANEAVLRQYYDHIMGPNQRPSSQTMGTLLAALKKAGKGDNAIIAALDAIKEFHRNPLMHPEHTLTDIDEAISLYAAIRAAIGYMLDKLPDPPPPLNLPQNPSAP